MKEDISKMKMEYENLVSESDDLDDEIKKASGKFIEIFNEHYPPLVIVPVLRLSPDEMLSWVKSRIGNLDA